MMHGPTEYRILDQELQERGIHPFGVTGGKAEDGRFHNYSDPWALQCWWQYRQHYGNVIPLK
jgi:hypothetical protein